MLSNTGGPQEVTMWIRVEDPAPRKNDLLRLVSSSLKWKVVTNPITASFGHAGRPAAANTGNLGNLRGIVLMAVGVAAHDLKVGGDVWGRSMWKRIISKQ